MGNAIEFLLKLTDMLTPGMRQAAAVSESSAAKIQRQMEQTTGSNKQMTASVNELRERLDALNKVRFSTRIKSEFDSATREAQKLERQIDKLENQGRSSGSGRLAGLIGGVGITALAKGALGSAAEREQQQISFGVMTGSQKGGNKMLNDLVNMGAATPYESADLIHNAQTLMSFGVAQKSILPTLNMLGDVAGGNVEKLNSLSLAFAQISSAGKLSGQDLLQLVNAGFNPLQEISKITGMSMADLRKNMEKGAVSSDMVAKAFQHATGPGGMFHNMMEKQSQTLVGRWSTFMDNAKIKLLGFGNALMPAVSKLLDFGSALLDGEPAAIALAVAIGGVTIALIAAKMSVDGMTLSMRLLAMWQGIVNVVMAMNPIILIITLIIALGLWIYSLAKKYEGWGKSLNGLWEIIKGFVKLNGIAWKDFGENIWYWIQYAWLKVKGFVEWIGGAMSNIWNAIKLAMQFKFSEAKAALTAEIKTTASQELAELEKKHNAGTLKNQQDAMAAVKQMQDGYKMIGLKKKAEPAKTGADPTTASTAKTPGISASDFKGLDDGGKSKSVNAGGQRNIVINIGKQIEKLEVHVMNAKETAQEYENAVREAMRRVLYNVASAAS